MTIAILPRLVPEYVVLLKRWDHHTAALKAIMAGDAARAESEIVADITEAAHYLGGLADPTGQLRRRPDSIHVIASEAKQSIAPCSG